MEKDPSPLDTLRQLKEWLDAGTITPQEFETLKRKLLFSENASPSAPAQPPAPEKPPVIAADQIYPTYSAPPTPAPEPSRPPVPPIAPASSTTSGPIEDPLLPPVGQPTSTLRREPPIVPPTPPAPEFLPPRETARPFTAEPQPAEVYPADETLEDDTFPPPTDAASHNPLTTVLIVGGIVALLAIVAYLMLGNKQSERLTSTTITAADTLTTRPETGPQAEQIDLPPAAAPETVRVAPVVPPTPASTADTAAGAAAQTPAATPATAPVTTPDPTTEAAAQTRIQGVLNSFYEDMQAAPFAASTYFAPQVERFYLMQNTSPAAINDELAKSYFPEFLEAQNQIEPGTLKISPPVNDGSRVATYIEKIQSLRQSMQKHQQTRAQVRARFDKNFKIVYLRQEKLLENTFTE
ncbi:SHOCT domain-containing protein [Hymenobacter wooponensis]|uniref:SHOCT domain-containing protein n=1 Tax=Hymenobacter wooponensis TaxID=1525360 RepID=UPI001436A040|nr:SHOCT domain-containing protein [Hymenobacter wooponensis]